MLKRALRLLGAVVNPAGPLGEVLSPADVYKSRLGLPVQSPHNQRVEMALPGHIEHTLAPARFVRSEDALDVPKDRVRQVSAFVEEVWAPVYAATDSTDAIAIVLSSQTLVGWNVTQRARTPHCDCAKAHYDLVDGALLHRECGRARRRIGEEDFRQQLQSENVIPSDDFYNGYAPTIPGNDPVIINGEVLRASDGTVIRGGTNISGGRRQWREATKGMALWDKGFEEQRAAALAEEESRPVRNVKRAFESYAGEFGPMWRPVGINQRRDRRSAV